MDRYQRDLQRARMKRAEDLGHFDDVLVFEIIGQCPVCGSTTEVLRDHCSALYRCCGMVEVLGG